MKITIEGKEIKLAAAKDLKEDDRKYFHKDTGGTRFILLTKELPALHLLTQIVQPCPILPGKMWGDLDFLTATKILWHGVRSSKLSWERKDDLVTRFLNITSVKGYPKLRGFCLGCLEWNSTHAFSGECHLCAATHEREIGADEVASRMNCVNICLPEIIYPSPLEMHFQYRRYLTKNNLWSN